LFLKKIPKGKFEDLEKVFVTVFEKIPEKKR
jgi:hypothetical protein